jgi:hypothetical protein
MDEMGPVAAKSYLGQPLARVEPQAEPRRPAQRARQEIDYGRRDKGYVFGAFRPVTGEALTKTYGARSTLNWVDFLQRVDEWLPADLDRVYAIVDNLSTHRASDVLLFSLHPVSGFEDRPGRRCALGQCAAHPANYQLRLALHSQRQAGFAREPGKAICRATDQWASQRATNN